MGQTVGAAIQLPVAQMLSFEHRRHRVRASLDLSLESIEQTARGVVDAAAAPLGQKSPLLRSQQRHLRKTLVWIGDRGIPGIDPPFGDGR
jgi:hypothetical protein